MNRYRRYRNEQARLSGQLRVINRILAKFDWSFEKKPGHDQVMAMLQEAYQTGQKNGAEKVRRGIRAEFR